MSEVENIETFYKRKLGWLPNNIRQSLGHFNVFCIDECAPASSKPVPYKKRDYYKITFIRTSSITAHYADKSIDIHGHALVFSNPQIPYTWDKVENIEGGYFCIFNADFFSHFGQLAEYPLFKPGGSHIFELDMTQSEHVVSLFKRMQDEINSNYPYKYDVIRTLIYELLHFAMKIQLPATIEAESTTSFQRVTTLFVDLLERQFPLDNTHQVVKLHTPSDFAQQLNIHVNYLNRSIKSVTGKTTGELIAQRLLQEAKVLLKYTSLSISEISYMLGFAEPSRFNYFFKKHSTFTPSKFRKSNI